MQIPTPEEFVAKQLDSVKNEVDEWCGYILGRLGENRPIFINIGSEPWSIIAPQVASRFIGAGWAVHWEYVSDQRDGDCIKFEIQPRGGVKR